MKSTLKRFKENSMFFIIVGVVLLVLVIFSFFAEAESGSIEEVEYLPDSNELATSKVIISEISSSNAGVYADKYGNTYDWIELYNGSNKDKTLDGYSLSDTKDKIKWPFPSGTIIKAKSYLIIFLKGSNAEGLYANFKLKSGGGETLVLRNAKKKVIDAIETKPVDKNYVMSRMNSGGFIITSMATPGYENSQEGYEKYISSISESKDKKIAITEILPNNKGHFKNSYGIYSGYIEVTNISSESVDLSTYTLSNNMNALYKWTLPSVTLNSGEVLLIYTSNKNTYESEYHSNFKLSNRDGVVILMNRNNIEDKVEYNAIPNGMAYIKGDKGFYESNLISPGYKNNTSGINEFQDKYLTKNKGLIINEAMNSNYSLLAQNGNNYYDWIELYNNSNNDIDLKDYYLTTNQDSPKMYNLPDVKLKSGGYYILMASGNIKLSNNSYNHTNFKLSEKEGIYLYKDSKVVDSIFIADVPTGYSYGRDNGNGFSYFSNPSPGAKNGSGTREISYTPLFSKEAGVYNNVDNILLEITGEGNVYYTTDGSTPTTSSNVYKGPIKLTKTTVVRAASIEYGKIASEVQTSSYIINENHTLPVMSISMNPSDFNAISRNAWTVDYEKPSYAEFFEDGNSFSIPAGFKLFGGSTRGHAKKSFSINFRKKYGKGSLEYKVFDNRDNAVYDSLVLRTGSQDEQSAVVRDILGTSLVDGMINVDVQAYKSIILYINGDYRGVYFIREKVNEDFISSHYNVNGDNTDILRIDGAVSNGTSSKYRQLISYVNSHDLSKDEYYDHVASLVDIDSIIDYWVAEDYVTNNDIVNCRYFSNPDINDGKWKFVFYDLDYAFYNYSINYYKFSTNASGMTSNGFSTALLRNLMKNKKFQKKYVERISYQLKNVWNTERVLGRLDEIVESLTPEMERNFKRWGGSMTKWHSELDELKTYINKRTPYMISQAKSFFSLSNKEMDEYFGGIS